MRSLLFVLVLLTGLPAVAAPSVVVAPFEGPTGEDVRTAAIRALADRAEVEMVGTSALMAAARKRGVSLDDAEGFEAACDELRVAAVLIGKVARKSGSWTAQINLRHRATGDIAGRYTARASNLRKLDDAVRAGLWNKLGAALASAPTPNATRRVALTTLSGPGTGLEQIRAAFKRTPWLTIVEIPPVGPSPRARAAAARKHRLDGLVSIDLVRRRRRWRAQMVVIGPDGQSSETVRAEGRRSRQVATNLAQGLDDALEMVAPPPVAAPPPAPKARASTARPKTNTPEPPASVTAQTPSMSSGRGLGVEVGASFRVLGRNLSYNDDLFGGLRPYDLAGAPMLRLEGAWFPGQGAGGVASWFGLEVLADLALGVASSDGAGRSFGTSAFALVGGARVRIPIGGHALGVSLGGGLDSFTISDAEDGTAPGIPAADYAFLRAGVDGKLAITPALSVQLGAGWRQVLSPGEISSDAWFPNASVAGVDARVRGGYELLSGLEVQVDFELKRYFSSFDPQPGDFPVAGGAVDQFWSAALGATYRF